MSVTESRRPRRVARGGFWDTAKNTYSAETQQLLKEMMQESKLTSLQQRRLKETMQNGDSLPLQCAPNCGQFEKQDFNLATKQASKKVLNVSLLDGGKRTKDTIEAMGAYDQPTYRPHPGKCYYEKEKQKLANIMTYGKDMQKWQRQEPKPKPKEPEEIDRFEELQNEIEERYVFLQEMESLGRGKKYKAMIQTEISQRIHEMEMIDKKRTLELEKLRAEKEKLRMQVNSPIPGDSNES